MSHWCPYSLRGRRSKGKGKGIKARDHARGRREEREVPFLSPSRAKFPLLLLLLTSATQASVLINRVPLYS